MTAPVVTATRTDLIQRLDQLMDTIASIASDLPQARYADSSLLNRDRAKLGRLIVWAGEVMESLAVLGTDPEGRE
jgi:hypothetical protein